MPGCKITMLPPAVVERFTLAEGGARPAASFYVDVDPETFEIVAQASRIELVPIDSGLYAYAGGTPGAVAKGHRFLLDRPESGSDERRLYGAELHVTVR